MKFLLSSASRGLSVDTIQRIFYLQHNTSINIFLFFFFFISPSNRLFCGVLSKINQDRIPPPPLPFHYSIAVVFLHVCLSEYKMFLKAWYCIDVYRYELPLDDYFSVTLFDVPFISIQMGEREKSIETPHWIWIWLENWVFPLSLQRKQEKLHVSSWLNLNCGVWLLC